MSNTITLAQTVTIPKQEHFGDYETFADYKLTKSAEAEIKKEEAKNKKLPPLERKFVEYRNKNVGNLLKKYYGRWQKNENRFLLQESSDAYKKRWTDELWKIYTKQINDLNEKFNKLKFAKYKGKGRSNTYRYIGRENQNLKCNGIVKYGARRKYRYKRKTGNFRCDNRTFGDPIRGFSKKCYCRTLEGALTAYVRYWKKLIAKWTRKVEQNEGIIFRQTYRKDRVLAIKKKKEREERKKRKVAKKIAIYKGKRRKLKQRDKLRETKLEFKEEKVDILRLIETYAGRIVGLILLGCGGFALYIYLRDVQGLFNEPPNITGPIPITKANNKL